MSSLVSAEHGYGMYLNDKETNDFIKGYLKVTGDEDVNPSEVSVVDDIMGPLGEPSTASELSDDMYIMDTIRYLDGAHRKRNNCFHGVFFYADKQGEVLRDSPSGNIYPSLSAMADEFRGKYSKYLPDDFDYEGHMAELTAAYSC